MSHLTLEDSLIEDENFFTELFKICGNQVRNMPKNFQEKAALINEKTIIKRKFEEDFEEDNDAQQTNKKQKK